MTASLLDAALAALDGVPHPRSDRSDWSAGAQAIMHDGYKRSLGLATSPDALTLRQRQAIIAHCQPQLAGDQPGRAFDLLAGLLLGRRPDAIADIGLPDSNVRERWVLDPGLALAISGIPMRSTRPDVRGRFTLEEPGEHILPLPDVLGDHLERHLSGLAGRQPFRDGEWMSRLNTALDWPTTGDGIAKALSRAIRQCDHDDALASLITGKGPMDKAALHYLHIDPVALQNAYRDGLEALSGGLVTIDPVPNRSGAGSTMTPRPRSVAEVYRDLPDYLVRQPRRSLSQLCTFHNRYAALVITTLAFATGHRPVGSPYDRVSSIHLDGPAGAFCWIDDKQTRLGAGGRLMPLSRLAETQFRHWFNHLAAFDRHVAKFQGVIRRRTHGRDQARVPKVARSVSVGALPIFFFVEARAKDVLVLDATRSLIKKHVEPLIPFTPTAPRHALRRDLQATDQPADVVAALMGHADAGGEPFGVHSGLSVADLLSARDSLDDITEAMGIVPLRGLK